MRPLPRDRYWAIVADYDFNTAICELVDNPIDLWLKRAKQGTLTISIEIDVDQQVIRVDDDSGGISKYELKLIVQPGASGGVETDAVIGIFGVGSKRSAIALAKDIKVTTQQSDREAYRVEYGEEWLATPTWDVPCFQVPPKIAGHTTVELAQLRDKVTTQKITQLRTRLSEVYGRFLANPLLSILVNGKRVKGRLFENWAYPPDYLPLEVQGKIETRDGPLTFTITGGLLTSSAYASGEYGVYFYCNERLIAKELRTADVGFFKGAAGVPHHSHAASRVVVSLTGPAKWMPWNSSKSGMHFGHDTFKSIQDRIIAVTSTYAVLSKRLLKRWDEEVFPYKTGEIRRYSLETTEKVSSMPLAAIPAVRPNYAAEVFTENLQLIREAPWRERYVDAAVAVHSLQRQNLATKNDLMVILLDGIFGIAMKEFLVSESDTVFEESELVDILGTRDRMMTEVKSRTTIPKKTWEKLEHLQEAARRLEQTPQPLSLSDATVEEYRNALQVALRKLFGIRLPDRTAQTFS